MENTEMVEFGRSEKRRKAMREKLPYGRWVTNDGTIVLFNRGYRPIVKVSPDGRRERADPDEWIRGIKQQEWYYYDGWQPWHHRNLFDALVAIADCSGVPPAGCRSTDEFKDPRNRGRILRSMDPDEAHKG